MLLFVRFCEDQKMEMVFTPGMEQYKKTDGCVFGLIGCPEAAWLGIARSFSREVILPWL